MLVHSRCPKRILQTNEAVGAVVKHLDRRTEANGRPCRELSHGASTDDDHFGRSHTRDATEQRPAAFGPGEQFTGDEHGGVAGNFSHGAHQWEDSVRVLKEVPGNRRGFLFGQRLEHPFGLDGPLQRADEGLAHAHQAHLFKVGGSTLMTIPVWNTCRRS